MRRVCYCVYSPPDDDSWAYSKDTAIWTNLDTWTSRPLCTKATPCKWKQGSAHPRVAQRGGGSGINAQSRRTQSQLYSMPPPLMEEWLYAVERVPDTALMTLVCAFASADCARFQPFGALFTSDPTPQAVDSAKASNIHTPASPPP